MGLVCYNWETQAVCQLNWLLMYFDFCLFFSSLLRFFTFTVAMKAMNKVASHINEMQKIHEEYGAVFDQLINEQSGEKKEVRRLVSFYFF